MLTSSAHRGAVRDGGLGPRAAGGGTSAVRRGSGFGGAVSAGTGLALVPAGAGVGGRRGSGRAATWCRRGIVVRVATGAATATAAPRPLLEGTL